MQRLLTGKVTLLLPIILVAGVLLAACQNDSTPAPAEAPAAVATEEAEAPTTAPEAATEEAAPEAVTQEAAPAEQSAAAASSGAVSFSFVADGTEARFLIDEVLMGQDKTVIGATSRVEGELSVDPADVAAVQVGEIRIDASDLKTDDDRRTRRLVNDILKSSQDAYRYITFQPTSITGLPATAAPGDSFSFQATGDLTILGTTRPVTFDMTVTAVDESSLQGTGSATVRYADFGISIPQVPMVASVSDEVILQIDFTAQKSS